MWDIEVPAFNSLDDEDSKGCIGSGSFHGRLLSSFTTAVAEKLLRHHALRVVEIYRHSKH